MNNFNKQHTPNSSLEASRMFAEQEAKQKQMLEEKRAKQAIEEKRHNESLSMTEKNVKLMEENNKICRKALWTAYISAFIALISLFVALTK